jgi:hypothetical protein
MFADLQGNAALFGRVRERTSLVLWTVVLVFVWFAVVDEGPLSPGELPTTPSFLTLFPAVVIGLAVVNAYWNDGLVVSWLLAFGVTLGLFWNGWDSIVVFGTVLTALAAGTAGHAIGLLLRRLTTPEAERGARGPLLAILLGPDRGRLHRWVVLAAVLGLGVEALVLTVGPETPLPVLGVKPGALFYPPFADPSFVVPAVLVLLGWTGLATIPAARGGGLFAGWTLVFVPFFVGSFVVIPDTPLAVDLARRVEFAFLSAGVVACVAATVGFPAGRALRRVVILRNRGDPEQGWST